MFLYTAKSVAVLPFNLTNHWNSGRFQVPDLTTLDTKRTYGEIVFLHVNLSWEYLWLKDEYLKVQVDLIVEIFQN